jgi:ABC-type glycerol-3-phosphate transport system substrate-binding protein
MKAKTKIYQFFSAILLTVFLAAGCGGGGGQTVNNQRVVLNVWKTFEDSETMRPLLEAFNQKYPNIEVVYTKKNVDNYEQDLLNALAAGTGPDIFSIHNDWLPKYLDKVAPAPEKIFTLRDYKDAFVDVVNQDFVKNNAIYGTALSVDSLALYYNKDLMGSVGIATPPKTWAELASHARRLRRPDGRGYFSISGVALGTNRNINRAADILYLFMLQQRAVPFSADLLNPTFGQSQTKNGNFYNPGQAALEFYTSFANPSSDNYNWNSLSDYSIDAFTNGRAAYLFSYAYTRSTIKQKNPNLNFDVAPVPQPNLQDPKVNFANYWGEVVSKQSKNSEAAWTFLKFITSKENLDKYYAQNKYPSSRRDLVELQVQDPEIGVFADANLTAKSFYKPDQAGMDSIFGKMIDNIILSGFRPEEALQQAEAQAQVLGRVNY